LNERHQLHAFYAIVVAVCYLTTMAAVLAYMGKMTEAVGVGAAITGLFALANTPRRSSGPTVENATTVNQGEAP